MWTHHICLSIYSLMDISDILIFLIIASRLCNAPNHVINFILDEINGLLMSVHIPN